MIVVVRWCVFEETFPFAGNEIRAERDAALRELATVKKERDTLLEREALVLRRASERHLASALDTSTPHHRRCAAKWIAHLKHRLLSLSLITQKPASLLFLSFHFFIFF